MSKARRNAGERVPWAGESELSVPAGKSIVRCRSVLLVGLADVMLGIKLEPELAHQIELGLEEVDVLLLVMHQLLEQIACHIVLGAVAVGGGFLVEGAGRHLGCQVAVERLLDGLSDMKRVEPLHVGKAVEEDDAV